MICSPLIWPIENFINKNSERSFMCLENEKLEDKGRDIMFFSPEGSSVEGVLKKLNK